MFDLLGYCYLRHARTAGKIWWDESTSDDLVMEFICPSGTTRLVMTNYCLN